MTDPATRFRCPYVGLQPYTEADIAFFFGRERDQRIIAANLGAVRLTILYGASGVGKSSVLGAGVVPYLRTRPHAAVVVVRDWQGPGFADALKTKCREAVERVLQKPLSIDLSLPLDEFLTAADQALQGSLLIIFDQFEEYFLYHPESETGQTFDAELARAINRDDVDAAFLIVLREDGLAKLDRFGGRIPNLLGNTLRLQHLTAADAEAAIRKPLDVFNEQHPDAAPVAIEDALVSAVIDQVRSGQVMLNRSGGVGQAGGPEETAQIEAPFLQLVMTRLWEEEISSGSRTLRLSTLERLGGAEKIVRMHLDGVMDRLDGARREVCAKFFDRLVTPSGTKIACGIRDLADWAGLSSGEVAPILDTFCRSRILRVVDIPGAKRQSDTNYEIYNDVLAPAILDWRRGHLQAQERADADRRAAEQAQAEAKAANAKLVRKLRWALSVAAVCAIAFLGLLVQQLMLQRAALARQARARDFAAAAQAVLESNPELGAFLAVAAVQATSSTDGSVTDAAADVVQHVVSAPHADKQLSGFGGAVRTMFFNSNGTRLVTTSIVPAAGISDPASRSRIPSWNPTTIVWDTASGSPVFKMISENPVSALALSPDGQRLATAVWDGAVQVFDPASGKKISTVAHDKVVTAVFSPDGERIATVSVDGTAKVSDASLGEELFTIGSQVNKVSALAYSPDAKWLAIASLDQTDQTVTVFDANTAGPAFKTSMPRQSVVTSVALNADGKRLAILTGASEQNVTVWEVPSGKFSPLVGRYEAPMVFSPDGRFLATIGDDGLVHIWSVTNAEHVRPWRTLFHADLVSYIAFSPDSSRIAMVSNGSVSGSNVGTVGIWDLRRGGEPLSLRGKASVDRVAFDPNGTVVAVASSDGTVSLWDLSSHWAEPKRVTFSAQGDRLATSGHDGTVKIWDAHTRRALGTLGFELGDIYGLTFSEDGGRLVTANHDRVAVWDLKDFKARQPMASCPTDLTGAVDVALTDDGKSIVAAGEGGEGGAAKVWNADLENCQPGAFGGPESALGVALSRDGRRLVAGSRDRMEIWDVRDGKFHLSWSIAGKGLDSGEDVTFSDVALSPKGRYVAGVSDTGLMLLWDVNTKTRIPLPADFLTPPGENASAGSGMAFSPDERYLAAAYSKRVAVWDIPNLKPERAWDFVNLKSILGLDVAKQDNPAYIHLGGVRTLAFNRDGNRLATVAIDGAVQVWPLPAEDLIAAAQAFGKDPLDEKYCNKYHIEPCIKSK